MKTQIIITTVVFCILLAVLIFVAAQTPVDSSRKAAEYVASLGWDIEQTPIERADVDIPLQFDSVYNEYNRLQKQAGFDLMDYRGKRVTRYTFSVKNFDDVEGVRANVLEYKGKIIGGDIMTVAIDGFMAPLTKR